MTFQFIIEYVDDELPFDYGITDNFLDNFQCIRHYRIRARTAAEAIVKFQTKFPRYRVIGWK